MQKKFWYSFACSFLLGLVTSAQVGTLQNAQGQPIPFARISVLGQPGWIVADAQGRFTLPGKLSPPFTLVVTGSDGVMLGVFPFAELPHSPLTLQILPQTEQVTVTASRPPDLVAGPATAFTLVAQPSLELRAPAQITDVLAAVPNMGRVGGDHAVVPAPRGLARFRSLILLDGTRVLTERRVGPSATFLDPLSLGEVEVVRGAGGVAYGSDAFGGIIAARTRLAAPGQPWQVRYALLGATGIPEQSTTLEASGAVGSGALTLGVGTRDFQRYDSPKGQIFNSEATFRSFRFGYQVPLGQGLLRALWRSDWGRDIGRTATTAREDRTTYPEENSHRFVVSYERQLAGPWSRYAAQLSWVEYQLITERDRAPSGSRPRRLTRADVFAHDYNARFEAERSLAGGQLLVGFDGYGRYGLRAINDNYLFEGSAPSRTREVSITSARKDDLGFFATYHRSFSALALHLGLREDKTTAKNAGGYFGNRSVAFTRASGFFGVTWKPRENLDATVQYARGFRDAILSDRFYRGITGRGFITGNPNLKPETAHQWDVALRYTSRQWQAAVYAYHYQIFDFIERYRSGSNYFFRNRGKARLQGLEGELSVDVTSHLNLVVGLQYPKGQVVDDQSDLDDVPARGGFLLLSHRRGRLTWESRLAVYARDTRPGPTEQVVPGYAVWDFGGSYRFSRQLEVGLYGRNLMNRAYPSSPEAGAVLAPGRSVQVSVRGVLGL